MGLILVFKSQMKYTPHFTRVTKNECVNTKSRGWGGVGSDWKADVSRYLNYILSITLWQCLRSYHHGNQCPRPDSFSGSSFTSRQPCGLPPRWLTPALATFSFLHCLVDVGATRHFQERTPGTAPNVILPHYPLHPRSCSSKWHGPCAFALSDLGLLSTSKVGGVCAAWRWVTSVLLQPAVPHPY